MGRAVMWNPLERNPGRCGSRNACANAGLATPRRAPALAVDLYKAAVCRATHVWVMQLLHRQVSKYKAPLVAAAAMPALMLDSPHRARLAVTPSSDQQCTEQDKYGVCCHCTSRFVRNGGAPRSKSFIQDHSTQSSGPLKCVAGATVEQCSSDACSDVGAARV
eukprot:1160264-Pelagomonas_calceolata.AAC.9